MHRSQWWSISRPSLRELLFACSSCSCQRYLQLSRRYRQALRWYWDHDEVLKGGGSELVLLLPGEAAFLEFQL